jgi:hypothetical protein
VVAVGEFGGHTECAAPKPWMLSVNVAMRDSHDVLTTHATPVSITVVVTP